MGPPGADRTQMGPMLAPWILLPGIINYWCLPMMQLIIILKLIPQISPQTQSCPDVSEEGCRLSHYQNKTRFIMITLNASDFTRKDMRKMDLCKPHEHTKKSEPCHVIWQVLYIPHQTANCLNITVCSIPPWWDIYFMMASSNGKIFRVPGHLCGKFTGQRWIPRTKAVTRSFAPESTVESTIVRLVIWDAIALIMTSL